MVKLQTMGRFLCLASFIEEWVNWFLGTQFLHAWGCQNRHVLPIPVVCFLDQVSPKEGRRALGAKQWALSCMVFQFNPKVA